MAQGVCPHSDFVQNFLRQRNEACLSCEPLLRGGNGKAWCVHTSQSRYFLKEYFRHPGDARDRLGAEAVFLHFCRHHGIGCVPDLLTVDREAGLALLSWVDGKPLCAGQPDSADIEEAASFFAALAKHSRSAVGMALPLAADACVSAQDHLNNVWHRVERMRAQLRDMPSNGQPSSGQASGTAPPAPVADGLLRDVRYFVEHSLAPAVRVAGERVRQSMPLSQLARILPEEERVVSPSDFGFHNALRTDDGLCFVDFEYAGRDDPAKVLCDFVCQPEVPVAENAMKVLAHALHGNNVTGQALVDRAQLFLPLHRIKWCCIMLNEFVGTGGNQREFARGQATSVMVRKRQFEKAWQYFEKHCASLVR